MKFLDAYKAALPFVFVFALAWTGYRAAVYQYNRDRCIEFARNGRSRTFLAQKAGGMQKGLFQTQCQFFGMGGEW